VASSFPMLLLALTFVCPALRLSPPLTVVGSLAPPPDLIPSLRPATYVDLSNPVTVDGFVSTVTFIWSAAPCQASAKVKFFRPSGTGDVKTLALLAERGPFDVNFVTATRALSPSVDLRKGDLIGITNLTDCGTATFRSYAGSALNFDGDVEGAVNFLDRPELFFGGAPEIRASTTELQRVENILPVAISAPGQSGSYFRTRLQLRNPQGIGTITGRLVFHPGFSVARSSDAALIYSLRPWETQTIEDFLGALSLTGIGSVDVVPSSGLGPTIQATIYAQAPGGGSVGFSEPTVRPAEALVREGTFVGPSDPARFRLNIGVRTLDAGATLTVVVFDATGFATGSATKIYPPNYFEQVPASAFLGGGSLAPNTSFTFRVMAGNPIIYGVTADNVSQNAVIRMVTPDL